MIPLPLWLRLLLLAAAVYAICAALALKFIDRMIFLPPPPSYDADLAGLLRLPTSGDETVAAVHLAAADGFPTLLYSHGNAEDLGDSMPIYRAFHREGFGVLVYDYPGYGQSTGRPDEAGSQRAIAAAWRFLTEDRTIAPSDIVLVGLSVGGGPSVWLDSRVSPRALVLIAPFTSTFAVRPPAQYLLPGDRFPNLRRIRESDTPLLVIHGENDRIIPIDHGRRLHRESPAETKRLLALPQADHNTVYQVGLDEILAALREFCVEQTGPGR